MLHSQETLGVGGAVLQEGHMLGVCVGISSLFVAKCDERVFSHMRCSRPPSVVCRARGRHFVLSNHTASNIGPLQHLCSISVE